MAMCITPDGTYSSFAAPLSSPDVEYPRWRSSSPLQNCSTPNAQRSRRRWSHTPRSNSLESHLSPFRIPFGGFLIQGVSSAWVGCLLNIMSSDDSWQHVWKLKTSPGICWSTMWHNPCVRIQNTPLGSASLTRSNSIRIQQLVDNVTCGLCGLADFFLRWPPISPDSRAHEVQLVPGALLDKSHLMEPLHLGPQRLPLLSHVPPVVLQPDHHVLRPLPQLAKMPHILGS